MTHTRRMNLFAFYSSINNKDKSFLLFTGFKRQNTKIGINNAWNHIGVKHTVNHRINIISLPTLVIFLHKKKRYKPTFIHGIHISLLPYLFIIEATQSSVFRQRISLYEDAITNDWMGNHSVYSTLIQKDSICCIPILRTAFLQIILNFRCDRNLR